MKKRILLGSLLVILVVITGLMLKLFSKENDDGNLRTIKVAEVAHSIFYAPFYVAIENGYFAEQGLAIDLVLTSGANNVTAAVLSGDVEVGYCGPEAGIYVYNEGVKDYIQTFAGTTKRDGQILVSRKKIDNFTWEDLSGKEVLGGRKGGMPILNLMTAVKNAGISNVNINDTIDFANLTSAFLSGEGDFVILFEPQAYNLEKNGFGYIVSNVGAYSGEVPYTTFNAKKSFIKNNPEVITGFRNAIDKALDFIKNNDAKVIANAMTKQFPDVALNDLTVILDRYKKADSWQDTYRINEKAFETLEDMIIFGGFIKEYVPFNDLIVNE